MQIFTAVSQTFEKYTLIHTRNGITNWKSLSKFQELVMDREAWHALIPFLLIATLLSRCTSKEIQIRMLK